VTTTENALRMLNDKCECFLNAYSGHLCYLRVVSMFQWKYEQCGPRLSQSVAVQWASPPPITNDTIYTKLVSV